MSGIETDERKCLEFSKKMAVLRKLVRMGAISEMEYILVKNRLLVEYRIDEKSYFARNSKMNIS